MQICYLMSVAISLMTYTYGLKHGHLVYGIFEKSSSKKIFNRSLKHPLIQGKILPSAKQQSLFSFIETVENLEQELKENQAKERTVFTDNVGLKAGILKETILTARSNSLKTNKSSGSISLNTDLNSASKDISDHKLVIDNLLSFVNSINNPPKGIAVIVDKSNHGEITLERVLVKTVIDGRKISAYQVIGSKDIRQNLINLSSVDNRIIIVDTNSIAAANFLSVSREVGLSGFNGMFTWIFFHRAKNALKQTCSRPGGDYLLFEENKKELTADYILNKVLHCQSKAVATVSGQCSQNITSYNEVNIYKLWTGYNSSYWVALQAHDKAFMANYQINHNENPLWPKLRVSIAASYEPWIFVVDFNKTHATDTLCGLGGRHGYRYESETSNTTVPICAYGLAIDILKALEEKLEFVGMVYVSRDGLYGSYNKTTGIATGIVKEIATGQADLSMDLMEDSSRTHVVDFSTTLAVAGNSMAYIQTTKHNSSVLGPFHIHVWITIFSCIAGFMLFVWMLEKVSPDRNRGNSANNLPENEPFDLPESMNYVWGIFFSGEIIDRKPRTFGNHVALIVFAFFSILILASYSANLITFFVVLDEKPLLTGVKDEKLVGHESKLKVGVIKGTSIANLLQFNGDPKLRRLYARAITFSSFKECFESLKNRKTDVIFGDTFSLKLKAAYDKQCSLKTIPIKASERSIGLVFQKGSTWKRRLNHAVMHMTSSGKSDKLFKTWFPDKPCIKSSDFFQLGIKEIVSVFYWLSSGVAGCVFIALVLAVWTWCIKWRIRKKNTFSFQN